MTFSFLLKPNLNISYFNNLTVLIAEIMVDSIKNLYNVSLEIKKPNDIMYNNKKLGGILTECFTKGEIVENIVIRNWTKRKSNRI